MKRLGMVFLLSVLVVGCQDRPTVTAPPGGLLATISDGAQAGGNADFFFLPPLAGNPRSSPNFDAGKFNPGLRPVVRVFKYAAGGSRCSFAPDVQRYDLGVAPVEGRSEQYSINWNTRAAGLVARAIYRICVFKSEAEMSAGHELGFVDYAFLGDRTLPIKFRIEGGLCAGRKDCAEFPAVPVGGANYTLPSGIAALSIPPGAVLVGEVVTVAIDKQAPLYDGECLPTEFGLEQSKGCYKFLSEPAHFQFHEDVRLEICVNPVGLDPTALRVWKYDAGPGAQPPEELPWEEPLLISCSGFAALNADGSNAPANLADAVWRGAGRLFANLVEPRELVAATMAGTPKGLGGLAGSFSDVGGAVTQQEGSGPDLYFGEGEGDGPFIAEWTPSNATITVNVQNIGDGSAGNFRVSLQVWSYAGEEPVLVTSFVSDQLTLGPSGNVNVTFNIACNALPQGGLYLKAEADVYNQVLESHETNNTSPESYFYSNGSSGSGYCGASGS